MNPSIDIHTPNGDVLRVQLDAERVRDTLNSPIWVRFLMEEFLGCKAISNVERAELLPLDPELTALWLETEGNELEHPPLDWQFDKRLEAALAYEDMPLIRLEANADRKLVRRCLNNWFGDAHGPMVVGVQVVPKADLPVEVDMTLV